MGKQRYQYEKYQQEQNKLNSKMKQAGVLGEEKEEDDGIDWHDYIIVQTIDLFEEEQTNTKKTTFQQVEINNINDQIKSQKEFENLENKKLEKKTEVLSGQALDP